MEKIIEKNLPLKFERWLALYKNFSSMKQFEDFLRKQGMSYRAYYYIMYAEYLKEELGLKESN